MRDAADWAWSNYRATAGLEHPPAFLRVEWTRGLFAAERAEACARYRAFIAGDC
jgi:hypothetical protein